MSVHPSSYFLHVALHAAILSGLAWLLVAFLRCARHRSVAAVAGLLGVLCLPWFSALRPLRPTETRSADVATDPLPSWTVATLPQSEVVPTETTIPVARNLAASPAKREPLDPADVVRAVWLAGGCVGLILIGIAWRRVRAWRSTLLPLDNRAWNALRSIMPEVPGRDGFRTSAGAVSPCVVGFWRPRILLPDFLFAPGSEVELNWALRHELAHLKAGDSRWMMVFALVRCLHWWNPFVHRLVACWAEAREQLCDLAACEGPDDRSAYGAFLIAIARKVGPRPRLSVAMARRAGGLRMKRRIVALLGAAPEAGRPAGVRFRVASIAVVLAAAGVTSGFRIGAAEPARDPEPDVSRQKEPAGDPQEVAKTEVTQWLVFSKTKPSVRNGAVFKDGELDSHVAASKKQGGIAAWTVWRISPGHDEEIRFSQTYDREKGRSGWIGGLGYSMDSSLRSFVRFSVKSEYLDGETHLEVKGRYAFIPGSGFPSPDKMPYRVDEDRSYRYQKAEASAVLKIGEAVCVDFGEVEPGVFLQSFSMVVPQTADNRDVGTYSGNVVRLPSPEVKGVVRVSGKRIRIPAGEKVPFEEIRGPKGYRKIDDGLNYPLPNNADGFWEDVIFSKIEEFPTVEIPLNEMRAPWKALPGFELKVVASEDSKLLQVTGKPADDAVDRQERTVGPIPDGLNLSFTVKSGDPREKARVFFKAEVVR